MQISSELLAKFAPPTAKNGYFISFEGIEASGKTTQIKHFQDFLQQSGFNVLLVREPGGTEFGEQLRRAILEGKTPIDPIAEAHLFAASRAQLLREKTLPHLARPNSVVIYDRYLESSLAYQGQARKLGMQTILELHAHNPLTTLPHLTFYLTISVECSLARQKKRGQQPDYFEQQQRPFYEDLIIGYQQACNLFTQRIHPIDGEQAPEIIFQQITQQWNQLIKSER